MCELGCAEGIIPVTYAVMGAGVKGSVFVVRAFVLEGNAAVRWGR